MKLTEDFKLIALNSQAREPEVTISKYGINFSKAAAECLKFSEYALYCVKIGKGYFSGFDETKVTYIIDDAPGALAQRIKYDSKEEAEMDAIQIGGTVEEVIEEWK
ncbi:MULTISPECIES: hypothetical protein [Enterococcus]|uniref:hypothetical protein n=1 Tax=Enterococcus TaxID=1350 RepID=UPI001094606B|nr:MULTISPECIES: hypothetical protein [Enterococcus]MCR1913537.1 hypothetical protein [Enterococcus hirae]TGY22708.1 hypothetical protein E5348_12185 [Enterococcus hirae]